MANPRKELNRLDNGANASSSSASLDASRHTTSPKKTAFGQGAEINSRSRITASPKTPRATYTSAMPTPSLANTSPGSYNFDSTAPAALPPKLSNSNPVNSDSSPVIVGEVLTSDHFASTILFNSAGHQNKKMFILKKLNRDDQHALKAQHPELFHEIVGDQVSDEIEISALGKGTFSMVRLAKDEQGKFYAVRDVLPQEELDSKFTSNQSIKREKVSLDTLQELSMQDRLKEGGMGNLLLLTEYSILVKENGMMHIYQFLPLADLGNGKEVIRRMQYLSPEDQHDLFYYIADQLLRAMLLIHAAGMAMNDIKPENILFAILQQFISFSDFGAACLFSDGQLKIASSLKDRHYLAPYAENIESCSQDVQLKKYQRRDLWSLALTLLEFKCPASKYFFHMARMRKTELLAMQATNSSNQTSANKKQDPLLLTGVIAIYQEALDNIYALDEFNSLSNEYQALLKGMLSLTGPSNLTVSLESLMANFSFPEIDMSKIPALFKKLARTPKKEEYNNNIFVRIKETIAILLEDFFPQNFHTTRLLTAINERSAGDLTDSCMVDLIDQAMSTLIPPTTIITAATPSLLSTMRTTPAETVDIEVNLNMLMKKIYPASMVSFGNRATMFPPAGSSEKLTSITIYQEDVTRLREALYNLCNGRDSHKNLLQTFKDIMLKKIQPHLSASSSAPTANQGFSSSGMTPPAGYDYCN